MSSPSPPPPLPRRHDTPRNVIPTHADPHSYTARRGGLLHPAGADALSSQEVRSLVGRLGSQRPTEADES